MNISIPSPALFLIVYNKKMDKSSRKLTTKEKWILTIVAICAVTLAVAISSWLQKLIM